MRTIRQSHITCRTGRTSRTGFTILEMLVATGVLALMVTILFSLFAQGSAAWSTGEKRADEFQGSRLALQLISRELSTAVVDSSRPGSGCQVFIRALSVPGVFEDSDVRKREAQYCEVNFLAPTELGNEWPTTTSTPYRMVCGVRYLVDFPPPTSSAPRPQLPSLIREVLVSNVKATRPSQFSLYDAEWWGRGTPPGTVKTSVVIVDNVKKFIVNPIRVLPSGELLPEPVQPGGQARIDNLSQYAGVEIGVSLVDRRTASRINEAARTANIGSRWRELIPLQTTTNWTTAFIQTYDRP
jgi:type II secretory pathway pseudopilin PulG